MSDFPSGLGSEGTGDNHNGHQHDDAWIEALVRSVAHLAAQLTMTQLRLRALATELEAQGTVAPAAVAARLGALATADVGTYLRENLGETLADVIDVDTLEADLIAYLKEPDE